MSSAALVELTPSSGVCEGLRYGKVSLSSSALNEVGFHANVHTSRTLGGRSPWAARLHFPPGGWNLLQEDFPTSPPKPHPGPSAPGPLWRKHPVFGPRTQSKEIPGCSPNLDPPTGSSRHLSPSLGSLGSMCQAVVMLFPDLLGALCLHQDY